MKDGAARESGQRSLVDEPRPDFSEAQLLEPLARIGRVRQDARELAVDARPEKPVVQNDAQLEPMRMRSHVQRDRSFAFMREGPESANGRRSDRRRDTGAGWSYFNDGFGIALLAHARR